MRISSGAATMPRLGSTRVRICSISIGTSRSIWSMTHAGSRTPPCSQFAAERRGQRELPGIGLAVDKRVAVVHPARRFEDRLLLAGGHLQPVAPAWCSRFALRCTLDGGRRSFMIVGMQVVTAAWAANQVALVDQTFEHQRAGVTRTRSWLASWRQEGSGVSAAKIPLRMAFTSVSRTCSCKPRRAENQRVTGDGSYGAPLAITHCDHPLHSANSIPPCRHLTQRCGPSGSIRN